MSQTNGKVLRVRLTKTPQLITAKSLAIPEGGTQGERNELWSAPDVRTGLRSRYLSNVLEGQTTVQVDMAPYGRVLKRGHVIGHGNNSYLVDEIMYTGTTAIAIITPPARRTIAVGDVCEFEPWFLGTMLSGSDFRTTYDAENVGMIQLGKITLSEAIIDG